MSDIVLNKITKLFRSLGTSKEALELHISNNCERAFVSGYHLMGYLGTMMVLENRDQAFGVLEHLHDNMSNVDKVNPVTTLIILHWLGILHALVRCANAPAQLHTTSLQEETTEAVRGRYKRVRTSAPKNNKRKMISGRLIFPGLMERNCSNSLPQALLKKVHLRSGPHYDNEFCEVFDRIHQWNKISEMFYTELLPKLAPPPPFIAICTANMEHDFISAVAQSRGHWVTRMEDIDQYFSV